MATELEDILFELSDKITEAVIEAKESHEMAMNSYGAGYDAGFLEGLRAAQCICREQQALADHMIDIAENN